MPSILGTRVERVNTFRAHLATVDCASLGAPNKRVYVSKGWLKSEFLAHVGPSGFGQSLFWLVTQGGALKRAGFERFELAIDSPRVALARAQSGQPLPTPALLPPLQHGRPRGRRSPPVAGQLREAQLELLRDKASISIEASSLIGTEALVGTQLELSIIITNCWDRPHAPPHRQLLRVFPLTQTKSITVHSPMLPAALKCGVPLRVAAVFAPHDLGMHRTILVFDFGTFRVGRLVSLSATAEGAALIRPIAPYVQPARRPPPPADRPAEELIPGEQLARARARGIYIPPAQHKLPPAFLDGSVDVGALVCRGPQPAWDSYARHWHTLLWLEEAQMRLDIRSFDQLRVGLTPCRNIRAWWLDVPGLAENRPSVQRGDTVIVRPQGRADRRAWEGVVHQVELARVLLKFDLRFGYTPGERVDVEFTFTRTALRVQHEAINQALSASAAQTLRPMVLPAAHDMPPARPPRVRPSAALSVTREQLNPEQREAVEQIVQADAPAVPYVVFGPPGTGKSHTLAAAIGELLYRAPHTAQAGLGGEMQAMLSSLMQVLSLGPTRRILICAPSNAATDSLTQRLIACAGVGPSELLRLYSFTHSFEQVGRRWLAGGRRAAVYGRQRDAEHTHACAARTPPAPRPQTPMARSAHALMNHGPRRKSVRAACSRPHAPPLFAVRTEQVPDQPERLSLRRFAAYSQGAGGFEMPALAALLKFRVVAATCAMAAKLALHGVPEGHFTHIVIDEAGHALEVEAFAVFARLVARAGAKPCTQLVLAGDPRQLSPLVRSPLAKQHGLERSLLERLMALPVYARQAGAAPPAGPADDAVPPYDPRCMTKLVRNYRSHPFLLELPSRLFYDSELRACADKAATHSMLRWEGLPNPSVPLLFHGVEGKDEREANSPSWFNAHEASTVSALVGQLLDYRASRVTADDIGVITPYRKQVQKIRTLLARAHPGAANVKVGSVEEFQGQERRIIIVSTVRSTTDKQVLEFDRKHNLGFVGNAKRFNVAITRAKALLIVVGNPKVLRHDAYWGLLLRQALDAGAYVGCDAGTQREDELQAALAALRVDEDDEGASSDPEGDDASEMTTQMTTEMTTAPRMTADMGGGAFGPEHSATSGDSDDEDAYAESQLQAQEGPEWRPAGY
jgi:hypothetical protein